MRLLLAAALVTAPLTAAAADVIDPLRAMEAVYHTYREKQGSAPPDGVAKVWQMAGRELRSRMVANSVCTLPPGRRAFECKLRFDPVLGGPSGRVVLEGLDRSLGEAGQTTILARLNVDGLPRQVRFSFTKRSTNGRPAYALQDVDGLAPTRWRLSEATASTMLP